MAFASALTASTAARPTIAIRVQVRAGRRVLTDPRLTGWVAGAAGQSGSERERARSGRSAGTCRLFGSASGFGQSIAAGAGVDAGGATAVDAATAVAVAGVGVDAATGVAGAGAGVGVDAAASSAGKTLVSGRAVGGGHWTGGGQIGVVGCSGLGGAAPLPSDRVRVTSSKSIPHRPQKRKYPVRRVPHFGQ
jgi:hypothetical protein